MADTDEPDVHPVSDVLSERHLARFPAGSVVETAFVLTKVRYADGSTAWSWQSPGITNQEELLGALIMQVEVLKSTMLDSWE